MFVKQMKPCSEKFKNYGKEGILSISQKFEEIGSKLVCVRLFISVHNKRLVEVVTNSSFCSLCNQVEINKPLGCQDLFKNNFAKVIKPVRKTYFCVICDIFVRQKIKKHLSTRDHHENRKSRTPLFLSRASNVFALDVNI